MNALVLAKKFLTLFVLAVAVSLLGAIGAGVKKERILGLTFGVPLAFADAPGGGGGSEGGVSGGAEGTCGGESCCGCEGSSF